MFFEVTTACGELLSNRLWISNYFMNGLFSVDLETKDLDFWGFFPNERIDAQMLHRWVFLYDERLFFIPFSGRNIHVFDGKSIESISICDKNENDIYICSNAELDEQDACIYLFPVDNEHDLIRFDIKTNSIRVIDSFSVNLKRIDSYFENSPYIVQLMNINAVRDEFIFIYGYKWLVKWNSSNEKMEYSLIAEDKNNMAYNSFWTGDNVEIYYQNGDFISVEKNDIKEIKGKFCFYWGDLHLPLKKWKLCGEEYYCYDRIDKILKVDRSKNEVRNITENKTFVKTNAEAGYDESVEYKTAGEDILVFSPSKAGYFSMNKKGEMVQILFNYDIKTIRGLYLEELVRDSFLMEERVGLTDYIGFICDGDGDV